MGSTHRLPYTLPMKTTLIGYARCFTDKQDLDQHIIENIEEAQDFATQWLWTYNNDRPNMGIGGITPAQKLKMAA